MAVYLKKKSSHTAQFQHQTQKHILNQNKGFKLVSGQMSINHMEMQTAEQIRRPEKNRQ